MASSSQRRRRNTDSVAQPDHHHQKKIAHRNKMAQQAPIYDVSGDQSRMMPNGDLSVDTSHHYSRDAYLGNEVPITPGLPTGNSVYHHHHHHHHQDSTTLATPTGPAPLNMSTNMRYPHVNTQFPQPVFDMFSNYDGEMEGPIFSAGLEPGASWHHHSIDSPAAGHANGFLDHEPELSSSIPSLAPNTTDNSPGYGSPDGSSTGHMDIHGNAMAHGALYHDYGLMFEGSVNQAEPYAVATSEMYNESETNPMSDADLFTTMAAEYMESRNGCIAQTGAEPNAGLEPIWPTMY
ncbi:Copper resistance protein CRF1 [Ceratocystis lukuohia]